VKKIHLIPLLFCLAWVLPAIAQVEVIDQDVSPLQVEVATKYVDNLNPTLNQEMAAYGFVVAPKGRLVSRQQKLWFVLDYQAELSQYQITESVAASTNLSDKRQNFNRYQARFLSRLFLADRWYIDAQAQHGQQTQKFGTGISRLKTDVLAADELTRSLAAVSLVYGNDVSKRFMSVKAGVRKDDYRDTNVYAKQFNVEQTFLETQLGFRQSSASQILARVNIKQDDYQALTRDDSKLLEGLVGFAWQATGKTRLEALVGAYRRTFNNQEASSGLSWSIDYSYSPRDDLVFSLGSSRFSDVSSSETTSDSVTQTLQANLNYRMSDRWRSAVVAKSSSSEFNVADTTFSLDAKEFEFQLGLQLREHSELVLSIGHENVSRSDDTLNFKQNEAGLMWRYEF
jgi:hypothetical protein